MRLVAGLSRLSVAPDGPRGDTLRRLITSRGARHTAGSSYAVTGAGQKVIGALLRHSDSASTERYTHVAPSATAAIVEARWLRLGVGRAVGNGCCAWWVAVALHFVYKRLSGFALEVQSQARRQQPCGENPRFPGASCAGTMLANMLGRLSRAFGRM